jgi:hypothetical protein
VGRARLRVQTGFKQRVQNIAFVLGAVGLSSGLLLYLLGANGALPSKEKSSKEKPSADVVVGAGSLWLKGSF